MNALTPHWLPVYNKKGASIKRLADRKGMYKVVQIWPGQTVTCLHTNRPGHIWTTLYICALSMFEVFGFDILVAVIWMWYILTYCLSSYSYTVKAADSTGTKLLKSYTPPTRHNVTFYVHCLSCEEFICLSKSTLCKKFVWWYNKICSIAMLSWFSLPLMSRVGVLVIHLHTRLHIHSSSTALVITIKLKHKAHFCTAAIGHFTLYLNTVAHF
jgi:hypothetical protein